MGGPKAGGLFGEAYRTRAKSILASRFLIPPFSVLNAREGAWQDRKRQWLSIGIKSELGRGFEERGTAFMSVETGHLGKPGDKSAMYRAKDITENLSDAEGARQKWARPKSAMEGGNRQDAGFRQARYMSPGGNQRPAMNYKNGERGDGAGRPLPKQGPALDSKGRSLGDIDYYRNEIAGTPDDEPIGGTSIFDPVLCELAYRWFCPPGGRVLDPFAGGSVRGIVAGEMGLSYTGIDLSLRQVEANRQQAIELDTEPCPEWINGDSEQEAQQLPQHFDFMFSCPPYGDLEVYSDDERDLSTMPVQEFQQKYSRIIHAACSRMRPDSFACFVVGDYRDKKTGFYQNLPAATICAFEEAGFFLYNYAILVTAVGSLPIRATLHFEGGRKLGKTHQDVLVFARGNPRDFTKTWTDYE